MFHFRLQRVLDYRGLRVERLEDDVQQLHRRLQHEEACLQALQAESVRQQEHLAALYVVRGEDLQMWRRNYQSLVEHIARQQSTVQEAAQALSAKQQELITARQEQKMLENMAEKAQQRYLRTLATHEQQLLDEIAIARSHHGH
jgi:flagellar export protein FliJ